MKHRFFKYNYIKINIELKKMLERNFYNLIYVSFHPLYKYSFSNEIKIRIEIL